MLLQKMFVACVYVSCMHVCHHVYVCVYVRVRARVQFTRDDGFLRRCASISLDERKKGRERLRREESRDIVNRNTYILFIVSCSD